MEKLLVLQIEDRNTPFLRKLLEHNRSLSKRHGFVYDFRESVNDDVPQYWWKVFVIEKIMQTRPDIEMIMWLDSDAYFAHFEKMNPLRLAAMDPDHHMWISPDAPPKYSAKFCAGSFLVRNNRQGRRIMREWRGLYNPKKWRRSESNPKSWATDGFFGGPDYEQGAFIDHLLPRKKELGIRLLPYHVFNEISCVAPHPECISIHLAGEYKELFCEACDQSMRSITEEGFDGGGTLHMIIPDWKMILPFFSATLVASLLLVLLFLRNQPVK